jgi:hypothetical protein
MLYFSQNLLQSILGGFAVIFILFCSYIAVVSNLLVTVLVKLNSKFERTCKTTATAKQLQLQQQFHCNNCNNTVGIAVAVALCSCTGGMK